MKGWTCFSGRRACTKGRGPKTCHRLSCSRHFYNGLIATFSIAEVPVSRPIRLRSINRDDGYHNMGNWIEEAVEGMGL